jgi:hypothetical protein
MLFERKRRTKPGSVRDMPIFRVRILVRRKKSAKIKG